jgi:alpha-tubulin suppressor-like RCC1 family protein
MGDNRHGQLGLGTLAGSSEPRRILALERVRICDVACGADHSVAMSRACGRLVHVFVFDILCSSAR